MATLTERNIVLVSKDSSGNTCLDYPLTKAEQVEDLEKYVKEHGSNLDVMTGATSSAAGKAGLAPAPAAGMQNKFLCADATWKDAGGLPVGHEFFTTNPNFPAGCIPLLGNEYSRTTYADLWAWVQTQKGYLLEETAWQKKAAANGGNVPFYSKGNGSTTFRVPALKCWVRGANSISEVGGYLAASLPNIEGNAGSKISVKEELSCTGALYQSFVSVGGEANGNYKYVGLGFDASRSNPIYGASDTVQPSSIVGLWCVKAYGTVTNVGSTDVSNISTGLTEAETRISALENHGAGATVVETYRNGTNWYRVWSDGWVEQGGLVVDGATSLTFLKPFVDANYTVNAMYVTTARNGGMNLYGIRTKTGMTLKSSQSNNAAVFNGWQGSATTTGTSEIVWMCCGQGA